MAEKEQKEKDNLKKFDEYLKSLEHSTLKVPYEVLNRRFRAGQKVIDKEVAQLQSVSNELEETLKPGVTVSAVTSVIGRVVDGLSALKRKAEEVNNKEMESTRSIKRRVEHLQEVKAIDEKMLPLWQLKKLDRMLVEYFLKSGYYNTALQLARHSNVEDLTNVKLFMASRQVEEALKKRETALCLAWCTENKSKLRKHKSTLEFNIRKQEFVELVKKGCSLQAVYHARKYFVNLDEEQMSEAQQVMGLLAFYPEKLDIPTYRGLVSDSRWDDLVEQFRHENFRVLQLSSTIFTAALQAGLSSLKTLHCYRDDTSQRNSNCPVCSRHLNELAQPLPFAHCGQSRLICAISGTVLNEHNPPLMLPNGYIYGTEALQKLAIENDNRIVCPRTKMEFSIQDAEKVYVM